jgi:hypothetical protein
MSNRKSLSKKLRFEVFKRDSFTCQYCGKVAPNVILEVDHIEPVSKGGNNNLLNLITSCFDCNRGKTNAELNDDSVVAKQRRQLELLQERREQIQLMFNWKKELDNLKSDTDEMVISYIENKIENFSLNDSGTKKISPLTKKYDLADILESIDLSASKYLKYDSDGVLTQESAEEFLNKIGGILVNLNKPPIEQKASYIKGICRNRFSYWDPKSGSIVLNNYINALRDHGWNDDRILEDLETEVIPKTKETKNWSEWRGFIEQWTEDVNGWEMPEISSESDIGPDELDECVDTLTKERHDILPAIIHIGTVFEDFQEKELLNKIDSVVLNYLTELEEYYSMPKEERERKPSYHQTAYADGLLSMFKPINSILTFHLGNAAHYIIGQFFETIEQYNDDHAKPEYFEYIANQYFRLAITSNE